MRSLGMALFCLSVLILLAVFVPAQAIQEEVASPFTLTDTTETGKVYSLEGQKDAKAVVLYFLGTECPLANRYLPRMFDLHATYAEKGVRFFAVNSNGWEDRKSIALHRKKMKIPFPVLLDPDQKVAEQLKIMFTPTVILLDPQRKVRYRGSVDDNQSQDLVKKTYLKNALDALFAGEEVAVKETRTFGCKLSVRVKPDQKAEITYSSHVARILYENCVSCHRPGQVAPFSLETYEQARRWARNIKLYTQMKLMPPWKPTNHGAFKGERWMSQEEIDLLAKWVDAGAPLGDVSKTPQLPEFKSGWYFGKPDLILETPKFELSADGDDEFLYFVLPTDLPEDKWVTAVEVRPGNYNIVHHIIAYVDTSGRADKLDEADPGPGYRGFGTGPRRVPSGEMSGWAPGTMPYKLPKGIGRILRKGARLVLEVHYHKNGRKETDQSQIGLYFAKEPIVQRLRWHGLINFMFKIPPGKKRYRVVAKKKVREDIHAHSVMPHMHLLGREATLRAKFPDGTEKVLIKIEDWDFNWQDMYHFKEPLALPTGTKLYLEAFYDNSADNPNNPNDPPKSVGWGEQTTDEMCVGFLSYTRDAENLPKVKEAGKNTFSSDGVVQEDE